MASAKNKKRKGTATKAPKKKKPSSKAKPIAKPIAKPTAKPIARGASFDLPSEVTKLRARVRVLEVELDSERRERRRAEERAAEIEAEAKRYYDHYVNVEVQNANVANLYVASSRLNETLRRDEVLEAIQEIVINLIGSEELVIYELTGGVLRLASSFGTIADDLREVKLGSGIIGRSTANGETWVVGNGDPAGALLSETNLTACIPLRVDGRVIGAIAIFRLLRHKRGLEDVDRELFALLGTQAAAALHFAGRAAEKTQSASPSA